MKNLLFIIALFFTVSFMTTNESSAQCNTELYTNKSLASLPNGYTFVKSYRIDGRGGTRKKIEYTCVFSKDTNYNIQVKSRDGATNIGIVASLYDNKRNRLLSSYTPASNKVYSGWTYKCSATGIYYLTFTFKNSTHHCGAAVLGFRR